MKNLFIGLIAVVLTSCAGNAQITAKEIGVNDKGVYKITIDEDFLKKVLEEQLKKDKNDAVLTEFEIVKDSFVNDPSKVYYILVAQNSTGSTKIAFDLELNNDNVFVASFNDNVVLRGTCTCSGCPRGCNARHTISSDNEIDWYCTACAKGTTGGCNKSVTVSAE